MTWNSGPMIGGATNWPRLNRSGFWTRPDPRDDTELVDEEAEQDPVGDPTEDEQAPPSGA